jgi:hypothetical protein
LSVYVKGKNIYNHIGHINKETLSIETVRNPKKHLFHKYNGYGFNSFVLTNAKHMRYIEIKIESCIYRVPISIWLSHGVQTTEESFEKQYILSKLIIEEYAI